MEASRSGRRRGRVSKHFETTMKKECERMAMAIY